MNQNQPDIDYRRIESAIHYIGEHHTTQPPLEEIAAHVHMSPYHFQRLFTRWAGISPKKFLQYLTLQYAKAQLREELSLSEIAHEAGLSGTGRLHILVKGTPFQLKVWEALLKIPYGALVSYQTVSEHVNNPRGLQATGGAIGKNPVAFLIPCHRVVRKTGEINGYRWGLDRKSALIGWEAAHL